MPAWIPTSLPWAAVYDYADLLLQDKRFEESLTLLNEKITAHSSDPRLYDLQARTYAALGRHQEKHRALSSNYLLQGNLSGAIEQLELARKAGSDYYQLSAIESELQKLKEMAGVLAKQKQ